MEASRRLRATRIPLLPRQVKTYFGLSQGDDIDGKEEGYGSDCAAEEEDASDLEETVPPSFRINLPNSPFCSATNGSNNISGLLVESARKSMEKLSQPKLSISSHKFQSSQQTSRTDDSRTITLAQQSNQLDPTSDIEHRQSFRINIPNSPFCSTYGTSMLESRPSIAQSSQNSIGGCSDVEIQNRTTATLKSTSEVPSFHFNIPNSPFNSTYNTTIATTMEPSVQPSVNVNYKETQESKPSDDVNSSNLNSEATTENTQNRTSVISMMESSFHFNIPNSPFNSTCSTPNATKSSIISSQPSVDVSYKKAQGRPDRLQSGERFEIEKQYHQLASQQPPSALNDKQTGKRADKWWLASDRRASQSGSMFSAMNGLRISGTFGGAGGDTEMNRKSLPVFHRFSTQLKSPFLRFPPLIESDKPEVVCAEDVESSVLKSVSCSSETTSNGVNIIECLNFHEAVKPPALKNDFGATSNCEKIVRNSSEKMDSVGTMEVNLSSIQHDPIVLCDDDKRVSLSNDGEKSSKEIMASSKLTSLAESAVPYLRPHSPLSMGDAVRQNESLKHIRLPSPIRFMRTVPTSPKSTRPIVPRPSFAPQNPMLNQIGRLYFALQSPSIPVPLPVRKHFTAFATPSSSNTTTIAGAANETDLSSPSRDRRSALINYGSGSSTLLTSTPLSRLSSASSARLSSALATVNNDIEILTPTVNEVSRKTTKPSMTTNTATPLKSVLKRRFTAEHKKSIGASEKNGVLSEIFINYSTPTGAEKVNRRKSVTFQQALPKKEKSGRIGEERHPMSAVGRRLSDGDKTTVSAVGGDSSGKNGIGGGTRHRLSAFVDYNSSFSTIFEDTGNDGMADGGLDDSTLLFASPCAKQIVLKQGGTISSSSLNLENLRKSPVALDKEYGCTSEIASTLEGNLDSFHTAQRSSELLNSTIDVFDSLTVHEEESCRSGDGLAMENCVSSPLEARPAEVSELFYAGDFDDTINAPARRRTGGSFFNSSVFTTNDWNDSGANDSYGYEKDKSINSISIISRPSNEGYSSNGGDNDSMNHCDQPRISSTSMESSFVHRLSCGTCDESSSSVRHFVLRKEGKHRSPEYVLPAPKIKCSEVDSPSAGVLRRSKRNRVARLAPGQHAIYRYGDDGTQTLVGVADMIVRDRQLKKYGCADPLIAADREWELKRFKKLQKGKKKEIKDRWHKTIKC